MRLRSPARSHSSDSFSCFGGLWQYIYFCPHVFLHLFILQYLTCNQSNQHGVQNSSRRTFKSSNNLGVPCFSGSPVLAVAELLCKIRSVFIPSEEYYIVLPLLKCQLLWPFVITPMTHCFLQVISLVDSGPCEQAGTQRLLKSFVMLCVACL